MSKPLGYYTSYTPDEDSLLEKLQKQYGSAFEKISKREKLSILMILASNLGCQMEGGVRGEIYAVAREMTDKLLRPGRNHGSDYFSNSPGAECRTCTPLLKPPN